MSTHDFRILNSYMSYDNTPMLKDIKENSSEKEFQQTPRSNKLHEISFPDITMQGSLFCNIRALYHRGRLPFNGTRLPLSLTDQSTHYVSFKLYLPSNKMLSEKSTLNLESIPISILCYERQDSDYYKHEISLAGADFLAKTCSEIGPCIYLSSLSGVYEFQCQATGAYTYDFWESQLKFLGVRYILPNDLFSPTSGNAIGEGSFAKVYTAIHRTLGKLVVIKRVPKEKLSHLPKTHLSAVHIEIEILRNLRHPYIVEFLTAFEDEFYYYIVLECLNGGTVNAWLRRHKRMTEQQAREAMIRIFKVLVELGNHNIVHRDLKLENLVLENSDDPTSLKVIDFGLAAFLGTPRMNMHCGSPGFVAPEIINKQPHGKSVDMFSAGILMYSFITGKTPFHNDDDTASETLSKNRACNITFDPGIWSFVSPEARECVQKLLAKNPSHRLTPSEALLHPWILQTVSTPSSVEIKLSQDVLKWNYRDYSDCKSTSYNCSSTKSTAYNSARWSRTPQNSPESCVSDMSPLNDNHSNSDILFSRVNTDAPYQMNNLFFAKVSRIPLLDMNTTYNPYQTSGRNNQKTLCKYKNPMRNSSAIKTKSISANAPRKCCITFNY